MNGQKIIKRSALCLLLVMMCAACGKLQPTINANEENAGKIPEDRSPLFVDSPDCGQSLTFDAPVNTGAVSLCKELVIVDRAVISDVETRFGFKSVIGLLGGNPNEKFHSWAKTWSKAYDNPYSREETYNILTAAWQKNCIRLVAVINRMDLTGVTISNGKVDVSKPGEGRLMYQVWDEKKQCDLPYKEDETKDVPVGFGINVEFVLPDIVSGNANQSTQKWAELWLELGKSADQAAYTKSLQDLVGKFFTLAVLQQGQIRTNDHAGPTARDWQLREFKVIDNELQMALVRDTPKDELRDYGKLSMLVDYVKGNIPDTSPTKSVRESLLDGTHELTDKTLLGMTASFPVGKTDKAWNFTQLPSAPTAKESESLSLLTFNTCNGCHHDMLADPGYYVADMHVALLKTGESGLIAGRSKLLSDFLAGTVELDAELPECRKNFLNLTCKQQPSGKFQWDESRMRATKLLALSSLEHLLQTEWLNAEKFSTPAKGAPQKMEFVFPQYRYH